jgi:hypothetical protein
MLHFSRFGKCGVQEESDMALKSFAVSFSM